MGTPTETWQLGGQSVQVSHLEKLYLPQAAITKVTRSQFGMSFHQEENHEYTRRQPERDKRDGGGDHLWVGIPSASGDSEERWPTRRQSGSDWGSG